MNFIAALAIRTALEAQGGYGSSRRRGAREMRFFTTAAFRSLDCKSMAETKKAPDSAGSRQMRRFIRPPRFRPRRALFVFQRARYKIDKLKAGAQKRARRDF
ncbi:hypothetical protein [Cloacibacillus sp. An23]|uniref:hypothetical protein n=1 Tax=Cloacibacillus sp. An23 TaxID=1965591 RepID=UPI001177A182|nr:hypothetical protein [Cloacibacillus sp. An23]